MQRIIFSFLIIIGMVFMSTCTKGTSVSNVVKTDTIPVCDSAALVNNPLNIKWVQQVIACRDCQFILNGAQMSTCIYNNKIVVYFENPASNLGTCVAKVYNCNGTILINWMDSNWANFEKNFTNKKIFWTK
jgi:hypothetical protein